MWIWKYTYVNIWMHLWMEVQTVFIFVYASWFFFSQHHCLPKAQRFLTEKRTSICLPEDKLAQERNVVSWHILLAHFKYQC